MLTPLKKMTPDARSAAQRIRVVGIARREPEAAPDDRRGEDVGGGFDGVSDERVRVAHESGDQLRDRQQRVDEDPKLGRPDSALACFHDYDDAADAAWGG